VLARYRRAALAAAPVVLIAGAVSVFAATADARTPSPASDTHAASQADVRTVHAQAEAHDQQTQQCSSTSSPASCGFATEIDLPLAISVTAQASPSSGQSATVTWTVSCSVNGGTASSSTGSRSGTVPFQVALSMPRSENGDCTVNATTTLHGGGSLTAVLAYTLGAQMMVSVPTTDPTVSGPLAFFMCMTDSKQGHNVGAEVVLQSCSYLYVGAWTYNGKTLSHGGLCLTDPHGGKIRTKLVMEKCTGAADQTWTYHEGGPFVLKSPHLCLDDPKYTKVKNTPLTVYSCNGGPDEEWNLSV
jgi:hypothetical protein